MSWLMRLFKKASDGTSVTLESGVTGGLIVPKLTLNGTTSTIMSFPTAGTGIFYHTTSPEGVITASKGSLCVALDTGKWYVKNTDSANTGWGIITSA